MTIGQILLGIIISLAANECCDVSPWAARKLVRWSARRRYVPPARAELRAEELAAYIDDRPGKLFKLIIALGFVAAAAVNRKTALGVAPPIPLWRPTTLTIPVHYEDGESTGSLSHPKTRAVQQAWCQLTDEVLDAAKEVGVGSNSWRRCIKELWRITGDDRWTLVARKLDRLEKIYNSRTKLTREETGMANFSVSPFTSMPGSLYTKEYRSLLTDLTVTHYQAAVETARAEIRHLTSDFLSSSTPR